MRIELAELEEGRHRFRAKVVRTGIAKKDRCGHYGLKDTVLLRQVAHVASSTLVTDHLWVNLTKGFERECLVPANYVEFDARVHTYEKGYDGDDSEPIRIHLVNGTREVNQWPPSK